MRNHHQVLFVIYLNGVSIYFIYSFTNKFQFDQYFKKIEYLKFNKFTDAIHRGAHTDPKRLNEEGDSTLELGELEQLCVNNEAETSYDVS